MPYPSHNLSKCLGKLLVYPAVTAGISINNGCKCEINANYKHAKSAFNYYQIMDKNSSQPIV